MANIATLLASILTTRYGRDMRQDLHDAIEAVNNDTENALGKSLSFTTNTRKLKLLAKDNTVLSEVVIPGGGSGGGSVDSVNGLFPDENGNVEVNLDDINDVDITSAADGQILKYNATSGKWENGTGGGGTTDYTDLTNKPQINGVTLSGNKTSADLGISGGGSYENLVPNGWFSINTKNTATFNADFDGTSQIDGWITNVNSGGQKWSWNSGTNNIFLNCTLGTGFGQLVHEFDKNPLISGKEFTLSVLYADGTIKTKTATYQNSSMAEWVTDTYNGSFLGLYSVPSSNNYLSVYFRCTEGYSAEIKAIKLEIGNSSTLIVDTFPSKNLELVRCNGVMRSNRNLLDNSWFTVNQKGFTSGNAAQNSTPIDRWQVRFNATTLALISSGLNITNSTDNHGIIQLLDMPTDYNNVYTFSMKTSDGTIYTKTGKFQTDISGQTQVISSPFPVYMGLWTIGGKLAPAIYLSGNSSTASFTITAMKLELGTESTLALDVAPNYTEELLKCQRFYVPLPRYWNGLTAGINGTYHLVNIALPTKMRAVPTISGSANIEGALNGASVLETIATSSMTVRNADLQFIQIEVNSSNQFDKNGNVLFMPSSGAALSAEL